MSSFAADLAAARQSIVRDPADAVVALLMEEFGIEEDPRANIGYQDEWYGRKDLVDLGIRVMVQGFGMTQGDAAYRMGYSASRAHNARRPPDLRPDELDLYDAACDLIGRPR